MNPDGSNQRRITKGLKLSNLGAPVVSPDGNQIVVGGYGKEVQLLNADGSVIKTFASPAKSGWTLDWSSTGKVLYMGFVEGKNWEELYSLDVKTGVFTPLTDDEVRQLFATWSPDGQQIAYMNDYVLWMMDADGSNKHQVAPGEARDLDWSPDGKQIVFEGLDRPHSGVEYDLWMINVDGTDKRKIADQPGTPLMGPSWSPDGSQVAFEAWFDPPNGNPQIMVLDVSTDNIEQLTQDGYNTQAFWVPDASSRR